MATLDKLKKFLSRNMETAMSSSSASRRPISDAEYVAGFERFFRQGAGWTTYRDFITPQLSQLLDPVLTACPYNGGISVLEIGPGPESVLGLLPEEQRRKIRKYAAFEPKHHFASRLEAWLSGGVSDCHITNGVDCKSHPFPSLADAPRIHRGCFQAAGTEYQRGDKIGPDSELYNGKYDLVLFCHSMYGMKPRRAFIERALGMLVTQAPLDGMVVVFHREGMHFDGLVCQRTVSFPSGTVSVPDNKEALDTFSRFVTGFALKESGTDMDLSRESQRALCRALGRRLEGDVLVFRAPEVMHIFTRHAMALPELTARVPLAVNPRKMKNRQARLHTPAAVFRPTKVSHIQDCVRWAIKNKVGLTVIGGSHGDHCVVPNVVSIDMSAFDQVHISGTTTGDGRLIIADAGVKSGDIIRQAMTAGLTVPLGSRPSVGAGLWLQGGIGHLARLYGLTSDAIVGAVMVSAHSGQILHVGCVPAQHQPSGSMRPDNDGDILWALKGAGTNFGIVVSVVFKSYPASDYFVRSWNLPLESPLEAECKIREFDQLVAKRLPRKCSADAYLYWDADRLHLGVTVYQVVSSDDHDDFGLHNSITPFPVDHVLGSADDTKTVDGIGLFETEMYISGMHGGGGHGGGKTCSFKRCVFLKDVGSEETSRALVNALETRPSPLCYVHLLHGGGAVGDVAPDATAFGCRNWDFACVVTGVWLRGHDDQGEDGTDSTIINNSSNSPDMDIAQKAQQWVYDVVDDLLASSSSNVPSEVIGGVYPADLGPDPRDARLVARAFGNGSNLSRLARLKKTLDPHNVLAYASPLPSKTTTDPKLIILVTGEHGAGKDYCANVWASVFSASAISADSDGSKDHQSTAKATSMSISDVTKRQYATATGADLSRLLSDRAYKETHRAALTAFFKERVRQRPRLPEEHFLDVVYNAARENVDVLFITGMRDEAPVAMFSHLVPDSRVIEVCVHPRQSGEEVFTGGSRNEWVSPDMTKPGSRCWSYVPDLIFVNDLDNNPGEQPVKVFAEQHLLPFLHNDLRHLESMVRIIPDFPRLGMDFRHVLGLTQHPGGIKLVTTSLLRQLSHQFRESDNTNGEKEKQVAGVEIDTIVACETGGFVFASALALQMDKPLVLIRKSAGKLPPLTCSVVKGQSHISLSSKPGRSLKGGNGKEEEHGDQEQDCDLIEIERDAIPARASRVLVVDDVLATGETLSAVLKLLGSVGVECSRVSVMVVAEFPAHRGRKLLREAGFGSVRVQSLLVFGGL